jgi:hypothetical protein
MKASRQITIESAIYATSQPDNRAGPGQPGARSRPKLDRQHSVNATAKPLRDRVAGPRSTSCNSRATELLQGLRPAGRLSRMRWGKRSNADSISTLIIGISGPGAAKAPLMC